jgi:probable HAF family extracellular repeat protein
MVDLGSFGGTLGHAIDINDSGVIVGHSQNGSGTYRAFYYSGGTMTDLGNPAGGSGSSGLFAFGINNAGQISTQGGGGTFRGNRWESGVFTGYNALFSRRINASGNIAGTDGGPGAWLIENASTLTPITGLAGSTQDFAYGINDGNDVVGWSVLGSGPRAFMWDYSSNTTTDLGTLGGAQSQAWYINNGGEVLGWAHDSGGASHAFIYTGGIMLDLNTMLDATGAGWTLNIATAMNAAGYIVGTGTIGGVSHAFLLTPIPEPGSWALGALGGVTLLYACRRRWLKH